MMLNAAIDIGTNSTRLLIARCEQDGIFPVYTQLETTRIGQGVGATGYISSLALSRTLKCLEVYMEKCRQYKVQKVRIVATSAVRDALNKKEVAQKIYDISGIEPEILSGEKEAKLSYLGAIADFEPQSTERQKVVLDIGGGSTELIYSQGKVVKAKSVNLGAVRLFENPDLLKDMSKMLYQLIPENLVQNSFLIGVGGTVTSLVAIKLGLEKYDPNLVHGSLLSLEDVKNIGKMLKSLSLTERQKVKGLQPERADIIPFGIMILEKVMELLKAPEIRVSEKDILYGMLKTLDGEC